MPLKREQKQKIIQDIKEKIDKQKAIIFVKFKGLKTKEIFALRESLKKSDCLLAVVKKTLLNKAFKEKKVKVAKKEFEEEVALVFGFEDEIAPARIVYQFSLNNGNLKILGGVFDNKFVRGEDILSLARLANKEELYSRVVGCLDAPIANFVNVIGANIRNFVYLLSVIKK